MFSNYFSPARRCTCPALRCEQEAGGRKDEKRNGRQAGCVQGRATLQPLPGLGMEPGWGDDEADKEERARGTGYGRGPSSLLIIRRESRLGRGAYTKYGGKEDDGLLLLLQRAGGRGKGAAGTELEEKEGREPASQPASAGIGG